MANVFIGALIFSIWWAVLFFGKSIGLSMLLFVVPITYYLIYILNKNDKIKNQKAKILIIPITLLASTYFLFDNAFFNIVNIIVIPLLLVLMIIGLLNEKFTINTILGKILQLILDPLAYLTETIRKLKRNIKLKLKLNVNKEEKNRAGVIFRGICITIPLALVIVILLASADETFRDIFIEVLTWGWRILGEITLSNFIIRLIITICIFLYLASFFDNMISRYKISERREGEETENKDNTTIKMVLGVLNIIYLVFCIIQIKSLFFRDVDITYAQYARQGFFQLMIVTIINLITILIAKRGESKEQKGSNRYINIMCIIMILFTFIILVSSAVRMYFYENAYGYTILRLLVYCALITEAILLIPTIYYIVDKKINLPKVYFIIIISMYVCMNFANFDNLIAKRNVDRYIETGKIDMQYLEENTGTGAVAQIMKLLDIETEDTSVREDAKDYLNEVNENLQEESMDFRDFNLSKLFAKYLLWNN